MGQNHMSGIHSGSVESFAINLTWSVSFGFVMSGLEDSFAWFRRVVFPLPLGCEKAFVPRRSWIAFFLFLA